MNDINTEPSKPAREPDDVARLKLTQALQRAQYAIAWERVWPHLARLMTVVGLFLIASWAGLWLALPSVARAIGLGLFALLSLGALVPLIRFRWPTREEALGRLDRGTGIRHRPATALTDTLTTQDPFAQALWQAQRERTLASLKRIRAGLPSPRLAIHDPWALRALVMVMLAASWVAAGDERSDAHRVRVRLERRAGADQYPGRCLGDAAGLYRQAADHPVFRQQGKHRARQRTAGGAGRLYRDRALQRRHARRGGGRRRQRSGAHRAGAQGHQRAAFHRQGRRHRACPRALRPAAMEVCRHARPRADHCARQGSGASGPRLAADVLQARGRLRRHRSPRAICRARPAEGRRRAAAAVRAAAVPAGAAQCAHPQRRRPDGEGSQRRPLCRRRSHADADGEG